MKDMVPQIRSYQCYRCFVSAHKISRCSTLVRSPGFSLPMSRRENAELNQVDTSVELNRPSGPRLEQELSDTWFNAQRSNVASCLIFPDHRNRENFPFSCSLLLFLSSVMMKQTETSWVSWDSRIENWLLRSRL
jgi:hypothetical protein